MMDNFLSQWALAGGAGLATVASPCVLPLLPFLLGTAVGETDRRRPLFIVMGFVLSFTAVALLFGASTRVLGLSPDAVRQGATISLLLAGMLMLWPALGERLMAPLGGIATLGHRLGGRASGGPLGGLLLGATLGAVWTPCAGPVLAAILALVANASAASEAAPLLLAYALGAGLPMLAIAHGGQAVSQRIRPLMRHAGRLRQGFGLLVVATAAAMLGKVDVQASAWLARSWSGLVSLAELPSAQAEPTTAAPGMPAPELAGIDQWLNTAPLSMARLKGKVVLIDFWTYGCVNCVRTLPHIQQLHARYSAQGLVVIGVHTPEFAFERSIDNVRAAVQRHGLGYPVAQDNRYQTWNAYGNRYWPAQYLVDRQGRIVYRHFGEGDEAQIEQQVQRALAQR
ncbi:MAG: cytochrome c biogenesis protein DipZ [Rubrivivax sp.]|nr:MAG: cytochrome c biogenesis protein DipZ [Rubrivivax sp.]